jgi:hypothetical protein
MIPAEKLKNLLQGDFVFQRYDVSVELQKNELKTESKFLSDSLSPRTTPRASPKSTKSSLDASSSSVRTMQPVYILFFLNIVYNCRFYLRIISVLEPDFILKIGLKSIYSPKVSVSLIKRQFVQLNFMTKNLFVIFRKLKSLTVMNSIMKIKYQRQKVSEKFVK